MTPQQLWDANSERVVRDGEFEVDDLAVYGPPYAVLAVLPCVVGGSSVTARFGEGVRLAHRQDLLAVVRPGR